ncbi:hypothetical protein LH417_00870 [Laribacter hongkongensis]|uniref:hypothetical protein n=1 Tax=Laribacter hongkongensis TaxID=168471 RepID=UPI00167F2E20|nr:hypothetical protein [Laribacter hongkongensis]MCG9021516.1 hypothetical protein [Laribacter hongkongensis]MCG9076819.1 hypothetical protein [Laribacter hongkongensis]
MPLTVGSGSRAAGCGIGSRHGCCGIARSLVGTGEQGIHQLGWILAGRNVDLDGPPDLFRYLLYEDGQPVEAGIDDLRIETALVRQGDRLQVGHTAGDCQSLSDRQRDVQHHRSARRRFLLRIERNAVINPR